jgi:peroxin-16
MFAAGVAHIPMLGLLSAFIKDWVPLIDEYHYCA